MQSGAPPGSKDTWPGGNVDSHFATAFLALSLFKVFTCICMYVIKGTAKILEVDELPGGETQRQ